MFNSIYVLQFIHSLQHFLFLYMLRTSFSTLSECSVGKCLFVSSVSCDALLLRLLAPRLAREMHVNSKTLFRNLWSCNVSNWKLWWLMYCIKQNGECMIQMWPRHCWSIRIEHFLSLGINWEDGYLQQKKYDVTMGFQVSPFHLASTHSPKRNINVIYVYNMNISSNMTSEKASILSLKTEHYWA